MGIVAELMVMAIVVCVLIIVEIIEIWRYLKRQGK
jgi:hypothetical protein